MQTGRPAGGLVVAVSIDAQHGFSKTSRLSIALVTIAPDQGIPGPRFLGPGLHIASQIAQAHGGRIDVTSTPGEARFTFKTPVTGAPSAWQRSSA